MKLMETSGTDILNDSDVRAPVSPLHLAVSTISLSVCSANIGNQQTYRNGDYSKLDVLSEKLDSDINTLVLCGNATFLGKS